MSTQSLIYDKEQPTRRRRERRRCWWKSTASPNPIQWTPPILHLHTHTQSPRMEKNESSAVKSGRKWGGWYLLESWAHLSQPSLSPGNGWNYEMAMGTVLLCRRRCRKNIDFHLRRNGHAAVEMVQMRPRTRMRPTPLVEVKEWLVGLLSRWLRISISSGWMNDWMAVEWIGKKWCVCGWYRFEYVIGWVWRQGVKRSIFADH